jgi:phage shock protein A
MNLLERVLTLLRANLNSIVEQADDPEKALRQLQLDMHNQLVQVKTQVATAIAEGHKLRKRSQERKSEAEQWEQKAKQAIQRDNDDAARAALTRYNDIDSQVKRYQQLQKEQEQIVATLRNALRQLEGKIAEVETTIDLLMIRKRNALIQQRVYDELNKTSLASDKERVRRAQDEIMQSEARARALADLHKRDLDTQLEQLSAEQKVEQQLQELKDYKRSSPNPPLLHEGNPRPAPLQRPQPTAGEPARKRPKKQPTPDEATTEPSTLQTSDIEQLKKLFDKP